MPDLSEPNIRVTFVSPTGDHRWIDFRVPSAPLEGPGLSELLIELEAYADAVKPREWPVGVPCGPWTVEDWERIAELEAEMYSAVETSDRFEESS